MTGSFHGDCPTIVDYNCEPNEPFLSSVTFVRVFITVTEKETKTSSCCLLGESMGVSERRHGFNPQLLVGEGGMF